MGAFTKVLVIYNGNAGQKDSEKALGIVLPIIAQNCKQLLILQTEKQNDAMHFCEKHGETVELVVVLGGDGTVHECVNGLSRLTERPVLAIIPGGTCNDFSRALQMPQKLKKAVEAIFNGEIISVDVGQVNDEYFLNFWGIGLIAETSENIDETQKDWLGKVSYLISAMRTFKQISPFSYTIKTDDQEMTDKAVMIVVLNGNYIGANPWPFSGIEIDDGMFNVIVVKESNLSAFTELISSNKDNPTIQHFKTKSLLVQTEQPMKADMDGEIYVETPANIKILHHHLSMIRATDN